jgi:hypothetical protein
MKKKTITDTIFTKRYNGVRSMIPVSDLPPDLLPTDFIDIEKDEGYYSDNNSWDSYTNVTIYREREETDGEFKNRVVFWEKKAEESKKLRFEEYLKLKDEFEPEKKIV